MIESVESWIETIDKIAYYIYIYIYREREREKERERNSQILIVNKTAFNKQKKNLLKTFKIK